MSKTTIAISETVKLKLLELKVEEGAKSFDELLKQMIVAYKKYRFLEASRRVRERMRRLGVNISELTEE